MIEFCNRKRMVIAIIVLVGLSMLTLIMEGMWSTQHKLAEAQGITGSNESCPSGKEVTVTECSVCETFEMKSAKYCETTGYKEVFKCKGEKESRSRSCRVDPKIAERKFLLLEMATFLVGLGSYGIVRYRQTKLDRMLMDKVNRQIAA